MTNPEREVLLQAVTLLRNAGQVVDRFRTGDGAEAAQRMRAAALDSLVRLMNGTAVPPGGEDES